MGEFLDSLLVRELDPDSEVEILVADGLSNDGVRYFANIVRTHSKFA